MMRVSYLPYCNAIVQYDFLTIVEFDTVLYTVHEITVVLYCSTILHFSCCTVQLIMYSIIVQYCVSYCSTVETIFVSSINFRSRYFLKNQPTRMLYPPHEYSSLSYTLYHYLYTVAREATEQDRKQDCASLSHQWFTVSLTNKSENISTTRLFSSFFHFVEIKPIYSTVLYNRRNYCTVLRTVLIFIHSFNVDFSQLIKVVSIL